MPILIDMEKPKCCERYADGDFDVCPFFYGESTCAFTHGAPKNYMLEGGWILVSDNCPLKEIVLCRDCKHRPLPGSEAPLLDDAEASFEGERDYRCPCLCYDSYYSWTPKDNFFCGYGERRKDG